LPKSPHCVQGVRKSRADPAAPAAHRLHPSADDLSKLPPYPFAQTIDAFPLRIKEKEYADVGLTKLVLVLPVINLADIKLMPLLRDKIA